MVKQADAAAVSRNLRRFILFVIFLPRIGLELPRPFAATPQRPATEYSLWGRKRRRGGILPLGCNRCKRANREIYAGISMIQFPLTKNAILTALRAIASRIFREALDQSVLHRTLSGIHRLLPGTLHEAPPKTCFIRNLLFRRLYT
jgi:hypothetical protein